MQRKYPMACVAVILCAVTLAACSGGGGSGSGPQHPALPPPSVGNTTATGTVYGGQSPVTGSVVTLYAAGVGSAASQVGNPTSTSTIDKGHWNISFNCPAGNPWIYAVAVGGNPGLSGTVNNSALRLVAALGRCDGVPVSVNINEVTTVATVYALNAFIDGADPDDISTAAASPTGLDNAMAMAATLADPTSGDDGSALLTAPNSGAQAKVNALADALAACVNTDGSSTQCTALFDCATPGALFNGGSGAGVDCTAGSPNGIPTDTLQVALAIARDPGTVSMPGIYEVATQKQLFPPALSAAPNDWTLALNFANVGLSEPTSVALDAAGNVWIANYNDRVVELNPVGAPLSGAGGFTGGGLHESFGLAIDAAGHVWVANEESTGGFNSNHGSITELSATDGSVLSGVHGYAGGGLDFPQAVAIDAGGNVWAANAGNASVSKFSSIGTAVSPSTGYAGGGIAYPVDLAFAPSGDLWIANQAANTVSALQPSGMPLSPTSGYTPTGLDVPQGVALDSHGNVWVTNAYGGSVTEIDGTTGTALMTTSPYGVGGMHSPGGIAIDGAGRIWVANYNGSSVTELAGADDLTPGAALSPATGFTAGNFLQPYAPAIDASGNVWVSNFGNASVTVLVGAAAPVAMPRIGVAMTP